jgi:Ni,Fe-hydrogenase I cytochrome b subunit
MPSHAKKPGTMAELFHNSLQTLAMVMMVVMTVMMIGGSISRYYCTGKNDKCNDSKKQQLHGRTPSR